MTHPNVLVPGRFLVRITCIEPTCERHHAPHLDNPGRVMSWPAFTLAEARNVARSWERDSLEFSAQIFDPSGNPVTN